MASNVTVINRWYINYKPSIILEAIMLTIMHLVLNSNHLFILWHCYQVGREKFHTRNQFPTRTKQWVFNRKGHNF